MKRLHGTPLALLTLGFMLAALGLSLLVTVTPATVASVSFLVDPIPLHLWAGMFLAVGGLCLGTAITYPAGQRLALLAALSACVFWGFGYFGTWLVDGFPRGYVNGAIFWAFAGLILSISQKLDPPMDEEDDLQ